MVAELRILYSRATLPPPPLVGWITGAKEEESMKSLLKGGIALAVLVTTVGIFTIAHEGMPTGDGIVKDGEYANHYTNEALKMALHWTIDTEEGTIYVALEAPTKGWVGLGLDTPDGQSMDWIIGTYHDKDNETDALDAFQEKTDAPAQADTFLGGSDDIVQKAAAQTEQATTFEFVRLLNTGDKFDVALLLGVQNAMLAFGDEDEYEHFDQETLSSMIQIDFFAGTVSSGAGQ